MQDQPAERRKALKQHAACGASYSDDVIMQDGPGNPLMRGLEAMRDEYASFFAENPELRGEIIHRITAGNYVIDEEHIHGWRPEPVRAVAIYHVANGLIATSA